MRSLPITLALAAAALASCSSTSSKYLRLQAQAHDASIAVGDTVTVVDGLRPEVVMASAKITEDGRMQLPDLGLLAVAGKTPYELESELRARYAVLFGETELAVDVLPSPERFFVFGEVRRPGRYPLGSESTIYDAVMNAHPVERFADISKVRVLRGGSPGGSEMHVNVRAMAAGDMRFNFVLGDGDILYVPATPLGKALTPVRGSVVEEPTVRRIEVEPVPDN
jgi:polysaccharide export outer membrane protein